MSNTPTEPSRAPREGRSERSVDRPSRGADAEPEVVAGPKRRQFSAEYKARIVADADASNGHGETGALRREMTPEKLLSEID